MNAIVDICCCLFEKELCHLNVTTMARSSAALSPPLGMLWASPCYSHWVNHWVCQCSVDCPQKNVLFNQLPIGPRHLLLLVASSWLSLNLAKEAEWCVKSFRDPKHALVLRSKWSHRQKNLHLLLSWCVWCVGSGGTLLGSLQVRLGL